MSTRLAGLLQPRVHHMPFPTSPISCQWYRLFLTTPAGGNSTVWQETIMMVCAPKCSPVLIMISPDNRRMFPYKGEYEL